MGGLREALDSLDRAVEEYVREARLDEKAVLAVVAQLNQELGRAARQGEGAGLRDLQARVNEVTRAVKKKDREWTGRALAEAKDSASRAGL